MLLHRMVARETMLKEGLRSAGVHGTSDQSLSDLLAYAEILAGPAIELGFVGPAEGPRLLERHVLDSAALLPHLKAETKTVDVGSGAGLPGIVLAILGKVPMTLIEAERKRAKFLEDTARTLELDIEVRWGRSEELGRKDGLREGFGSAVCRALAAPAVALEYLLPFVHVGGCAVIAVGRSALDARKGTEFASMELGGGPPEYSETVTQGNGPPRWIMTVPKVAVTAERYPRRTGVPSKRPLGTPQGGADKVE